MKDNWKLIVIAITLGAIFPGMIIHEKSKSAIGKDESTAVSANSVFVTVQNSVGEIETLELDEYLVSVLLCEMPVDFSQEALKAQAVVARTYTLRRIEKGGKHTEFQLCMDSTCCQGFKSKGDFFDSGGKRKDLNKVTEAVNSTRNSVLTYDGELIEATYFSCSGGITEDAVAVWGKDVPYLQATRSPGEEDAPHYTDEVRYTSAEFSSLLGFKSDDPPGGWIESISYTEGGGVDEIRICGTTFDGVALRSALNLRSTAFSVAILGDEFVITTRGFGHRVGMSQYGAEAMALNGATYEEILHHYYKDVSLSQYNSGD